MHYQASFDSGAPPRFGGTIFKVGAALLSGAGLGFLAVSFPKFHNTSSSEFTSLVGGPASLRQSPLTGMGRRAALASLPGGSMKDVALAAIEASNGCDRDISMKANPQLKAAIANMDSKSRAELEQISMMVQAKKKAVSKGNEYGLPGVLPPLNWFDPVGFSTGIEKSKLLYYREAEIKHGRICMSATLGFLVGERYHPLYGGEIDSPSLFAVTDARIPKEFWAALIIAAGGVEALSFSKNSGGGNLVEGVEPGDIGYDPLGLLPSDPDQLEEIQNKEILNGRFAMISLLGMVAEEFVTKQKLHFPAFG